jgi:Fe-S-cluster containining protein
MPLTNKDIERITSLGFKTKFFIKSRNGWLLLKNRDDRCVFNNGVKCLIYKNRPEGCKLYPIIYDKDKDCAIFDKDCPYKENFKISKRKIKRLYVVVLQLEYEKTQRKNEKK